PPRRTGSAATPGTPDPLMRSTNASGNVRSCPKRTPMRFMRARDYMTSGDKAAPTSGPPPSSARDGLAVIGEPGRRSDREGAVAAWRSAESLGAPSLRPPPGGGPAAGLTHGLKSHSEPRRRRRFRKEVMGDEHGSEVLVSCYDCEEPSAPAGVLSSRPAGACLLK